MKLITIAGRKNSGKSELTNILVKNGYIRLSFAQYLKNMVAKLYDTDLDNFYNNKEAKVNLLWNDEIITKFCQLTGLKNEDVKIRDKKLESYRDALQFIGTEIIRKIDNNFHINKTFENIDMSLDYCIDDLRFISEKNYTDKINNVKYFYVIRPDNDVVSNHGSEIDLSWKDFKYHIINDSSKKDYIEKIKLILKNIDKPDKLDKILKNSYSRYNNNLFYDINSINSFFIGMLASGTKTSVEKYKGKYYLQYTSMDHKQAVKFKHFIATSAKIEKAGVYYNLYSSISPYVVENLKKWDFLVGGNLTDVPLIVKNNDYLFNYFSLGLINKNKDDIFIVANKNIIDYILKFYQIEAELLENYKNTGLTKLVLPDSNLMDKITYNISEFELKNFKESSNGWLIK